MVASTILRAVQAETQAIGRDILLPVDFKRHGVCRSILFLRRHRLLAQRFKMAAVRLSTAVPPRYPVFQTAR
jgi:hypothetical protein